MYLCLSPRRRCHGAADASQTWRGRWTVENCKGALWPGASAEGPVVHSLINPRFEKLRTDALFSWYSFIDDSVHATLEITGNANGRRDARCIDMMYLMKSALGAMTAGEMSQMYPFLSIHYSMHYMTHRATRIGPRFVGCQMIHITSNHNLFIATWPSPLPSWPCLLCKALKLCKNLPQAVLCIGRIDSWTC